MKSQRRKISVEALVEELKNQPLSLYHGSWFDLTDVALLIDLAENYPENSEISDMARKSLGGFFIHTNIGHTRDGLMELAGRRFPFHFGFGQDAAEHGCDYAPFYVYEGLLKNKRIAEHGGILQDTQTIDIEGIESHIKENKYCPIEQPIAFLSTISINAFTHNDIRDFGKRRRKNDNAEKTIKILFVEIPTHVFARICDKFDLSISLFYESNDADSDCFRDSLPAPICNAEWIISGRGGLIVYKPEIYPKEIGTAYYRFNDYEYVGHVGEIKWWNYYRNYRYSFYLSGKLISTEILPEDSTSSGRLIFKKVAKPINYATTAIVKDFYCNNAYIEQAERKINDLAKINDVFVQKMADELGEIYVPITEVGSMGFVDWFFRNSWLYYNSHQRTARRDPYEMFTVCLTRHLNEPWVEDYCKRLFRRHLTIHKEFYYQFDNIGANGERNIIDEMYSGKHCIENSHEIILGDK